MSESTFVGTVEDGEEVAIASPERRERTRVKVTRPEANQARHSFRIPVALRSRLSIIGSKALIVLAGASFPALVLWLWHLSAKRAWVSPLVLPPPSLVLQSFRETWADGTIRTNLTVSGIRVAKGFSAGAGIGLMLGVFLGLSKFFRTYVQPTFQGLAQVNLLAWVPLLILVFGIDEPLKIAAITWATLLPITIITAQGIAGIPTKWFELAHIYELTRLQVLWHVAIPAALPTLFTAIRSGLGAAWASLVVVELIASSEGIGFMVVWGRQLFQLDLVLVAIVLIGAVGLTLDLVLKGIELRLRRWQPAAK